MPMDSVHNYYERLVINEINEHYSDKFDDYDVLADMACIALNRIPPRYIRYDIDMSFYMSTSEHIHVEKTVRKAVKKAYKKVRASEEEKRLNTEANRELNMQREMEKSVAINHME